MDSSKKDRKNIIKKIKNIFTTALAILLLVGIFALGIKFSNSFSNREIVLDFGFKNVGQLVTQEWYGRILEDSKKDRKLFNSISIPFTESRLIFSLDVEVLAGLDFNEIETEILNDEKTVKVKLPHAQVYKSYEVSNSFEVYLDDESWFSNINAEEQQSLKTKIVEKGKQTAIDTQILTKADDNAKIIIKNMINNIEQTKDFKVEFEYK